MPFIRGRGKGYELSRGGCISAAERVPGTASQQVHCDTVWLWVALTEAEPAGKRRAKSRSDRQARGGSCRGVRSERTCLLRHSEELGICLPGFGRAEAVDGGRERGASFLCRQCVWWSSEGDGVSGQGALEALDRMW